MCHWFVAQGFFETAADVQQAPSAVVKEAKSFDSFLQRRFNWSAVAPGILEDSEWGPTVVEQEEDADAEAAARASGLRGERAGGKVGGDADHEARVAAAFGGLELGANTQLATAARQSRVERLAMAQEDEDEADGHAVGGAGGAGSTAGGGGGGVLAPDEADDDAVEMLDVDEDGEASSSSSSSSSSVAIVGGDTLRRDDAPATPAPPVAAAAAASAGSGTTGASGTGFEAAYLQMGTCHALSDIRPIFMGRIRGILDLMLRVI